MPAGQNLIQGRPPGGREPVAAEFVARIMSMDFAGEWRPRDIVEHMAELREGVTDGVLRLTTFRGLGYLVRERKVLKERVGQRRYVYRWASPFWAGLFDVGGSLARLMDLMTVLEETVSHHRLQVQTDTDAANVRASIAELARETRRLKRLTVERVNELESLHSKHQNERRVLAASRRGRTLFFKSDWKPPRPSGGLPEFRG